MLVKVPRAKIYYSISHMENWGLGGYTTGQRQAWCTLSYSPTHTPSPNLCWQVPYSMQFSHFNSHNNNLLPRNMGFLKHSGKCSKCKIINLSHSSFSFTQNKISNANSPTGMYVSLPGVRQLGTLATHKDAGITNSCFWKLHNRKPKSPLALLHSVPMSVDKTATRNKQEVSAVSGQDQDDHRQNGAWIAFLKALQAVQSKHSLSPTRI